jgi:FdrA protein
MPVRAVVRRSYYRDSMVLMRVADALRALPGVREAAALMGTPANHDLLASAGLATVETKDAAAGDLVIAVLAESETAAEAGLAEAERVLGEHRAPLAVVGRALPRTLDAALHQLPDANLVAISVPGAYAKFEALRALRRGLHVFLFSDNVSLDDEIELKRLAVAERLFCMGPDCGTAYVDGVGLGFANVVPRGRVGCVAASGSGLQAVVSRLAALGEGVSHGIGVGGRDLSAEVGGVMTELALEALAADATTEAIVVIGKPPAAAVVPRLAAAIGRIAKPIVVCCLGARPATSGAGRWVATLEDAAEAVVASLHGRAWDPRLFTDPADVRARLARARAHAPRGGTILGLYTGGTLAHEAGLVLEPLVGSAAYRLVDLGDDEFTRGRPHPMIDPEARAARVRRAGESADVGVLLLDLVLGRAVHPDPATPLAAAIDDARRAAAATERALVAVASVVGTDGDPQDLGRQIATLVAAGVEVVPSNAQAARLAALLIRPDLTRSLLGGS